MYYRHLAIIAGIIVTLFLPCKVGAEDGKIKSTTPAPNSLVAVIDVQRILQESLAAKSVQQQLEAQRAKFQSEISKEEADLRKAEQTLTKSRDSVSPDIFADREQQLRQRFLGVERHVQAKRKSLDQAFTDSMNVVRKNLLDIVSSMAATRGFNLVVVKQQTLWSAENLNITDEVLLQLNKDLPSVTIKVSPEEDVKISPP